ALNLQGIEGGILQMVNHGILIAALFLIAGAIEARTRSRRMADFGGLAARLPWLATAFMIAALAALGLPGLNSFAGEFLAFLGTFRASALFCTLGTLVIIPAAWYMLRFFQGVLEGPPSRVMGEATATPSAVRRGAVVRGLSDLRPVEFVVLLPLLALIVVLGILPGMLTARIESSVKPLLPSSGASQLLVPAAHPTGVDLPAKAPPDSPLALVTSSPAGE